MFSGEKPPMKPFTKRQQQWAWFIGLWCAGLFSALLLAALARWMLRML
jgi:hypothetical protein